MIKPKLHHNITIYGDSLIEDLDYIIEVLEQLNLGESIHCKKQLKN